MNDRTPASRIYYGDTDFDIGAPSVGRSSPTSRYVDRSEPAAEPPPTAEAAAPAAEPLIAHEVPFDDGGGYQWLAGADGDFECVGAPDPKIIGRKIGKAEKPEVWEKLHRKWQARRAPTGPRDNLEVAKELAGRLSVPHSYDGAVEGDKAGGDRRRAILDAHGAGLKTIVCSEFTNLTLAEAGHDLKQRYRHPADGLEILNADKKWVDLFSVVNNEPQSTAALLQVQGGAAEKVEAGSERARLLGQGSRDADFWYVAATTFVGMDVQEGAQLGAGAAAVALGGIQVQPEDRKPGDLQQRIETTSRGTKLGVHGHSSQIYSVKGPGTCKLGAPGSPKASVATEGVEPGWYEIVAGDGTWEIGPDTDPATVARFTAREVQLIDANQRGAGNDATRVGAFAAAKTDGSEVLSDGRLPTSKWIAWTASDQEATRLPRRR